MSDSQLLDDQTFISRAYRDACLAELSALKPGNVHLLADGHGMVVEDFIKSAEASCDAIASVNTTVGQRILAAVQATWQAVGCNTNLGIVLLSAPIIAAYYQARSDQSPNLRQALSHELNQLTIEDAQFTYAAIRMANPAGLGQQPQHDVHQEAHITLKQAMEAAQGYDRIAYQYAHSFDDIFHLGLPVLEYYQQQWERESWATSAVYLMYLSTFHDSHIARKFGVETAEAVRNEAAVHWHRFKRLENPKVYLTELLNFDKSLKGRGINPGTSADLTVATLLISQLTAKK